MHLGASAAAQCGRLHGLCFGDKIGRELFEAVGVAGSGAEGSPGRAGWSERAGVSGTGSVITAGFGPGR